MKTIEKNAEKIARNVLDGILARPEARYYLAASEEALSERISNVVRDVSGRLGAWLDRSEPRDLLFDRYTDLGATRCRQCMPLEEVAEVLLMIRKEICSVIGDRMPEGSACPSDEPADIKHYVHLLFACITQSIIAGYRNEQAAAAEIRRRERLLPREALRI